MITTTTLINLFESLETNESKQCIITPPPFPLGEWLKKNKKMNDYWNEPPEHPEVPECCDQEMDVDDDGNCQCKICGMMIIAPQDILDYTEELPEP